MFYSVSLIMLRPELADILHRFCLDPNGDEVEIHPAGEEEHEEHEGHDHESSGEDCHFHAGVE